ncbi:MAG TPA: condensation domain-containing protein, partial [Chloroflexota bacterium]|nr:condensation domain-containing protein [Chloroflexota bacterium]
PGSADKRLVAYVVLQRAGASPEAPDALDALDALDASEARRQALPSLRAYLQERLPAYMVPGAFVTLNALPLTPNGKLDRKALPAPETAGAGADGHGDEEADGAPAPVPPRTAAETTLAGIWAEVLGLPLARVGVEDNFFALGGDSILSIQVVARATRAGLRLTPRQLFQHQTVAELAAVAGTAPAVQAEQETLTGPVPLTPIQRWFFEQDLPAPQHWNQAHVVTAPRPLRPDLLRAAVGHVLEHHDALRLRFRRTPEGDWAQEYAPPDEVPCRAVDLSDLSAERQGAALEALAGEAQASLDLEHGPLLRAVHCILGGERPERLLIAIHHLVVDAVSWPILLEDLQDAYRQLEQGQAPRLAPKTTGFRTWAGRLMEHTASDAVQAERDYWASQPWESVRPLPVDVAAPEANVEGTAQAVVASLTPEETQALLQDAPGTYRARVEDLLLTALAQSFAAWTGERSLLVDLEGHGREPLFEDIDLSRTVGWFTALYPVLLTLDTELGGPPGGLKAIKEQLRRVPGKGLGYGLLRYLDAGGAGALRSLPQPEVSFNYLGRVEQPVAAQPDAGQAGQAAPALLVPAGGDCGPLYDPRSPRRHLLDVVCDVSEGRLQLRWIYSPAVHRRETVQGLADGFLGALRALLSPDREAPGAGFTPSDFPRARLDQKQLDTFLAGIGRAAKR